MPAPIISSQPECAHVAQPLPWQTWQDISTSKLGSVNGKYEGRRRIETFCLKNLSKNRSIIHLKCATLTGSGSSLCDTISPSTCQNWKSCLASVASTRYTRPGTIIRIGGLCCCI